MNWSYYIDELRLKASLRHEAALEAYAKDRKGEAVRLERVARRLELLADALERMEVGEAA